MKTTYRKALILVGVIGMGAAGYFGSADDMTSAHPQKLHSSAMIGRSAPMAIRLDRDFANELPHAVAIAHPQPKVSEKACQTIHENIHESKPLASARAYLGAMPHDFPLDKSLSKAAALFYHSGVPSHETFTYINEAIARSRGPCISRLYRALVEYQLINNPEVLIEYMLASAPSNAIFQLLTAHMTQQGDGSRIAGCDEKGLKDCTVAYVLKRWVEKDIEGITYWVSQHPEHLHEHRVYLINLMVEASLLHGIEALSYFPEMSEDVLDVLMYSVKAAIADAEIDYDMMRAVLNVSLQLPNKIGKEQLLPMLIRYSAPADAQLLIDELGDESKAQMQMVLVKYWSKYDPYSAGDYALTIADEQNRGRAIDRIVRAWATYDITNASRWLAAIDSRGEQAVQTLTRIAINTGNMQLASDWLDELPTVKLRRRTALEIIRKLFGENPNHAVDYLSTSTHFTAEEKQSVLARLQDG